MTEAEIMKALECCVTSGDFTKSQIEICSPCPYFNLGDCTWALKANALDLIKRKNAEIERVTKERDNITKTYTEVVDAWKITRTEAIKEYVAELLEKYCFHNSEGEGIVFDTDIYNLAKEMGVEL